MAKKKIVIFAILTIALVVGFYPFSTQDVPQWKLRVIDESERPYPAKEVTQAWKNYTFDRTSGQNFETRVTDANGYVEFPTRTTKAGLLTRAYLNVYARARSLAHGSIGIQAYVHANGPQGYFSINYTRGQPPPEKLILPGP